MSDECRTCGGSGYVDDPTACVDPECCYPDMGCPDCDWNEEEESAAH